MSLLKNVKMDKIDTFSMRSNLTMTFIVRVSHKVKNEIATPKSEGSTTSLHTEAVSERKAGCDR